MARIMKASGVEWIGDIPLTWHEEKHKYLFSCGKEIVGNDSANTQLLSLTTQGVKKKSSDAVGGKLPESFDTYQLVKRDDLIMCLFDLDCSAVFSGLSPFNGMISPAYKVLKCSSKIVPEFADYWFKFVSDGRKFKPYAKNLRYTLNYDEFACISMVLPEKEEQARIASFLDRRCAEIDSVIANTQRTIEEYKALKQSIITEAVTKGVRGTRPMKDSGIEWITSIPEDWSTIRVKYLLKERNERSETGLEEPLSMSQKLGLVPTKELDMVPNMATSFVGAKLAYMDDLVFNKLKAHLGVFSVSKYDGLVSPDYAVYYSTGKANLTYLEYLFKTPQCITEFRKKSTGIAAGLTRLYTDGLFSISVPFPLMEEQNEIVKCIDEKMAEMNRLISAKELLITELESYKKSLIYEYVTGKKEVPAETQEILTVNPILLKALLYAKAQEVLEKNCRGRIQIQKILFMIECMYDTRIGSKFVRQKFGPLDMELDAVETFLTEQKWLKVIHSSPTSYRKMENYKAYHEAYEKHFGQMNQEIERLIHYFENMRSSQAERFATLMAAWNDFLLDGNATPTDDELIREVRTNWHSHKENFKLETWQDTLQKMRAQHFEPHGYVSHTTMPE